MSNLLAILFIVALFWLGYCVWCLADALQKKYVPVARNEQVEARGDNEPEPRRGR